MASHREEIKREILQTFNKNVKDFGESKAVDDLSLKLANSIADGVIDKKQADSIAQALALSIGKQSVALQVIGQMNTILGPEGEDLKKDPVKARLMLLANANNRNVKLRASAESKDTSWTQRRKDVAAIAAYNINNLELATMLADQVALEYETQKKKLEVEIESTKNLEKKLELQGKLKTLVAEEKTDTQVMNNAILNQIITAQADWERNQSNSVWGAQADKEDAFFDSSKAVVENAYVGTAQEEASKTFLEKSRNLGKLGTWDDNDNFIPNGLQSNFEAQRLQTTMELLVGGKVLSPDEGIAMMDLFAGKLNQLDQVIRLSIQEHGQGKMKELFNMFSDFTNKDLGSNLVQYIVLNKKDPAEF